MQSAHRVIVNTGVQYFRSVISVVVTLYTARIVLNSLGVNDYGIFTLVGGVIGMLSFIQSTLSRTVQRFLNYYQGIGDVNKLIRIFNISIIIHLIVAFILILSLVIAEPIIFKYVLNIELEKLATARSVYFVMLATLFFNIISTPYLAALISHENIVYSSLIGIIDAFIKIPISLLLYLIATNERLIVYTWMMCGLMGFNFACYYIYARRKYSECKYFTIKSFNKEIIHEMLGFTGYNMYATFCVIGRSQGLAILLNRFYTTAINASYGIANQIIGQLNFLSTSIATAINPQIIKSEGMGNRKRAIRLTEIASKFSILLMSMILIPLYIYIDFILQIWLKEVPPMTGMFCRYVIVITLVEWSTLSLTALNEAIGNIRNFTLIIYSLCLFTVFLAWIILKLGYGAEGLMMSYALISTLVAAIRVVYMHFKAGISISKFYYNVFSRSIIIIGLNTLICYSLSLFLPKWGCILVLFISIFFTGITTLFLGLKNDEKNIFHQMINRFNSHEKS